MLSPRHCGRLFVRPARHTCLEMEKEDGSHPRIMDRTEPVMRSDPVSLFYGNNVPPPGGFVPSADRTEISAKASRTSSRGRSRELIYRTIESSMKNCTSRCEFIYWNLN